MPPFRTTTTLTDSTHNHRLALSNLSLIRQNMDSLHNFLSDSVSHHTSLGLTQLTLISTQIDSALHQIIINGAALVSISQSTTIDVDLKERVTVTKLEDLSSLGSNKLDGDRAQEMKDEVLDDIVELDAVELLSEHIHFCEICGKGFKRDANLRMHMRSHGNQFKTLEALSNPDKFVKTSRKSRFSCPFIGCNRNKMNKKFRHLKSAVCVKNHFKRSHCPKMFSCNRCNKKSFSVVADLKSHLKHCGELKWKCSCGTTFSRKDKLFGHIALFKGHVPAAFNEGGDKSKKAVVMEEDEEDEEEVVQLEEGEEFNPNATHQRFFDEFFERGFGVIDDDCLKGVFGSP